MTLTIKKKDGFIELWIVLPICLLMLFVFTATGIILLGKIELEKIAWFQSIQRTTSRSSSLRGGLQTLPALPNVDLPPAFAAFVSTHRDQSNLLTLARQFPTSLSRMAVAASASNKVIGPDNFRIQTNISYANSPMVHNDVVKMGMLQKAMMDSGFNYPISMLGFYELKAASVPMGKLGGDF